MSVAATSAASPSWQTLADLRASSAAATDPAPVGTASTASSGAAQPDAGTTAITAGIAPPAPGLLQFLQQLQSSGTTPGSAAAGETGSGTSSILGELQSFSTQLLQGTTDAVSAPPAGAAPATNGSLAPYLDATSATGTSGGSSATDSTQTGNDLALQMLTGFPGAAGGLFGLAA